ncbi:MAG: hypothetical protein PHX44_08795 [Sulfurimonas sp.]|uniref:hypothetical protein n=1 Tax=Sulfurimonas sp. TaxID=2022749 RepID=UPI0026124E2A|nr:hypothetical protein [Sulfurimonas sp.]MDD2653130.1 hypothetical protein [Sulfurimonas sp.]MDD3451343.1 hypothetical protein [Sulfurimonas sp.]
MTNKKSAFLLGAFLLLFGFVVVEIFYLSSTKNEADFAKKREFVATVGLADLAISTEASYIRHRSMSDFFSIYRDDGTLRDYFASTYVYKANDAK